jgi:uncharacterized membrane protein YqgA involved in biofilm formation
MTGLWMYFGIVVLSAIVGGLIGIERQLLRIAKALEEKNKSQQ